MFLKSFILLLLCLFPIINAEFVVESQDIDGHSNIRVPKDLIHVQKKQTALHLLYQKEKERLDKLSKPKKSLSLRDKSLPLRSISLPASDAKINRYNNIRHLDMSDSTGNIILHSTFGDQFSVNDQSELNLTLENGSTIKLKNEAVNLNSGDIINIVGKNNVIEVSSILNINGLLLFDTDSQLTIKFIRDDGKVVFADDTILNLESNVELKFSGDGTATFGNNSTINLKGNESYINLYPSLIVDTFATLSPAYSSTLNLSGVGKVIIQEGGVFDVRGCGTSKYVNIGLTDYDNLDVYIKGKGMLRIDSGDEAYRASTYSYAPPSGFYGNVSFGLGKYSLNLKQGGTLYIGAGGWLEFNSIGAQPSFYGYLKKMDFGPDSNFYLNKDGLLSFAENNSVLNSELETIWISKNSQCLGDGLGLVEYIRNDPNNAIFNYQGFVGNFQAKNFAFNENYGISTEDLSKKLVNQSLLLKTAIFYTDNNNVNNIRLKNGVIINFIDGDTITSETSDGEVLAIDSNGQVIKYRLSGRRY